MKRKGLSWRGWGVSIIIVIACVFMSQNVGAYHIVAPTYETSIQGIDVSRWNGTIDWEAVAALDQVGFAIATAGQGSSTVDSEFSNNWQGIAAAGLIRGAVWDLQPNGDPSLDMDFFLETVGAFGPGDLPPILRMETTGYTGAEVATTYLRMAVDQIKLRTGLTPIIYTNAFFWEESSLENPTIADMGYPDLWIAYWGSGYPPIPDRWYDWVIWQYSSSGTVNGISGVVGMNYFNGSAQDLRTYANASVPEPATIFLFGTGLVGLAGIGRKKIKK